MPQKLNPLIYLFLYVYAHFWGFLPLYSSFALARCLSLCDDTHTHTEYVDKICGHYFTEMELCYRPLQHLICLGIFQVCFKNLY